MLAAIPESALALPVVTTWRRNWQLALQIDLYFLCRSRFLEYLEIEEEWGVR